MINQQNSTQVNLPPNQINQNTLQTKQYLLLDEQKLIHFINKNILLNGQYHIWLTHPKLQYFLFNQIQKRFLIKNPQIVEFTDFKGQFYQYLMNLKNKNDLERYLFDYLYMQMQKLYQDLNNYLKGYYNIHQEPNNPISKVIETEFHDNYGRPFKNRNPTFEQQDKVSYILSQRNEYITSIKPQVKQNIAKFQQSQQQLYKQQRPDTMNPPVQGSYNQNYGGINENQSVNINQSVSINQQADAHNNYQNKQDWDTLSQYTQNTYQNQDFSINLQNNSNKNATSTMNQQPQNQAPNYSDLQDLNQNQNMGQQQQQQFPTKPQNNFSKSNYSQDMQQQDLHNFDTQSQSQQPQQPYQQQQQQVPQSGSNGQQYGQNAGYDNFDSSSQLNQVQTGKDQTFIQNGQNNVQNIHIYQNTTSNQQVSQNSTYTDNVNNQQTQINQNAQQTPDIPTSNSNVPQQQAQPQPQTQFELAMPSPVNNKMMKSFDSDFLQNSKPNTKFLDSSLPNASNNDINSYMNSQTNLPPLDNNHVKQPQIPFNSENNNFPVDTNNSVNIPNTPQYQSQIPNNNNSVNIPNTPQQSQYQPEVNNINSNEKYSHTTTQQQNYSMMTTSSKTNVSSNQKQNSNMNSPQYQQPHGHTQSHTKSNISLSQYKNSQYQYSQNSQQPQPQNQQQQSQKSSSQYNYPQNKQMYSRTQRSSSTMSMDQNQDQPQQQIQPPIQQQQSQPAAIQPDQYSASGQIDQQPADNLSVNQYSVQPSIEPEHSVKSYRSSKQIQQQQQQQQQVPPPPIQNQQQSQSTTPQHVQAVQPPAPMMQQNVHPSASPCASVKSNHSNNLQRLPQFEKQKQIKKQMDIYYNTIQPVLDKKGNYVKMQRDQINKDVVYYMNEKKCVIELETTKDDTVFNIDLTFIQHKELFGGLKIQVGPFDDLYEIIDCRKFAKMKKAKIQRNSNKLTDLIDIWWEFLSKNM